MLTDLNGLLIGLVSVTTLAVMIYWNQTTHGRWFQYGAGKSMMGLLGIIAVITALATYSTFVGPFEGRSIVYGVTYVVLEIAIILVGVTILGAQRTRSRRDQKDSDTPTPDPFKEDPHE